MTRKDTLMTMNGAALIKIADKLGVKAACNKTRTALKEAKAKVIARILEAEAVPAIQETPAEEPEPQEPIAELTQEAQTEETAAEIIQESEQETPKELASTKKAKTEKRVQKQVAEPAEIMSAVTALDNIFDTLNNLYFCNLLPKAAIMVRRAAKTYDCCSVKKGKTEGQYNIEVCASTIDKSIEETASSLLHAMVHLYCMEMGIAETCQKGRYHNSKFKKECESRDLIVNYDSANGFVYTKPSEVFAKKLKAAGMDLNMKLAAIPEKKKRTK